MFSHIRGHTIYTSGLRKNPVVLDLGANHGDFSRQMQERFGASCYLAEANPKLAQELAVENNFHVWHCAATGEEGVIEFNISDNDEASSILALPSTVMQRVQVKGRPISSLMAELPAGEIDLLKVDIEGAEIQALQHIPPEALARLGQITVEFHSAPEFGLSTTEEVKDTIRFLRSHGFLSLNFSATMLTDVLFLNRRRYGISLWKGWLWEMAGVRPQWLRNLRSLIPTSARRAINRLLDQATGRDPKS